jgi:hypothetical protein
MTHPCVDNIFEWKNAKRFYCTLCGNGYTRKTDLGSHILLKHQHSIGIFSKDKACFKNQYGCTDAFTCRECGFFFSRRKAYETHRRSHKKGEISSNGSPSSLFKPGQYDNVDYTAKAMEGSYLEIDNNEIKWTDYSKILGFSKEGVKNNNSCSKAHSGELKENMELEKSLDVIDLTEDYYGETEGKFDINFIIN